MDKEAFSPDPLKCYKTGTRVSVNGMVEQMKKKNKMTKRMIGL